MQKIAIIVLALSAMSCRPTSLLQSGLTEEVIPDNISKIAVIAYPGILKDAKTFESAARGVFNTSKVQFMTLNELTKGADSLLKRDQKGMHSFLIDQGVDGIIEVRFVSIRKEESSSEDQYPTRREYRIMDDTHYSKLIQEYGKREEKGAIYEDTRIKMDIRLLVRKQNTFTTIWSCRTDSQNPKSHSSLSRASAKKAKKALRKEGILY
ncbi:MAG: hypothetical protein RIC15_09025 [Vicingaceae bacterium]